jgi:hypothetical protein
MKVILYLKKYFQNNLTPVKTLCLIFMLVSNISTGATYYIDSAAGIDSNNGTSMATPWKNITKMNNKTFLLNDKIFLKSGSVWFGQQLKFSGSGSAAFPIIIDQYGTGPKPILNGSGGPTDTNGITLANQGVIYLYNQDYIEINNLEITNYPLTTASIADPNSIFFIGISNGVENTNPLGSDRRGVMVVIKDKVTTSTSANNVCNHIHLKNLYIHHVKGQLGLGNAAVNGAVPKRTGGILFTVLNEAGTSNSRFNDVLIDGCEIAYCENTGLAFDNEDNVYYPGGNELAAWTARKFTNVKVSNNIIHHIGKNAMIIRCTDETGLIERNVCYETALGTTGNTMFSARAKGTVFQYNEGYFNRATTQTIDPGSIDGSMYDPDFGSVGVIFQYSYSHDNCEGIYWGCNTRGSANNDTGIPDPEDVGCTLRYCVSQNDKGNLVFLNYASAGNEIYNNIFYIKPGSSPTIIKENSTKQHTYNFFNNIIYNLSSVNSGATYNFATTGQIQIRNIKNNVFFGAHPSGEPQDSAKLISNPLLMNPGSATIGLTTLNGYKLQQNSPAILSGRLVTANGGLDYFGSVVSATTIPNRGVYEGAGLSAASWLDNKISIYPNPIENNHFSIRLPSFISGDIHIEIVDLSGKIVFAKKTEFSESDLNIYPTMQLAKGIYIVTINNNGFRLADKIIVK